MQLNNMTQIVSNLSTTVAELKREVIITSQCGTRSWAWKTCLQIFPGSVVAEDLPEMQLHLQRDADNVVFRPLAVSQSRVVD